MVPLSAPWKDLVSRTSTELESLRLDFQPCPTTDGLTSNSACKEEFRLSGLRLDGAAAVGALEKGGCLKNVNSTRDLRLNKNLLSGVLNAINFKRFNILRQFWFVVGQLKASWDGLACILR